MPTAAITGFIGIQIAIAIFIIFRTSIVSPLSIFTAFNAILSIYLFYTQQPGFNPSVFYAVLPYHGIQRFIWPTVRFFTILNVAALVTSLTVPNVDKRSISALVNQLRFMMSTGAILFYLLIVTILTLAHIIDFNTGYLWSYIGYHTINDPIVVGISNPVSFFYHRVGPLLAALCWGVAVVCFHTKRRGMALYAFVLGSYGFLLILASSSREIAQFFVVPAIVHYFFKRKVDFFVTAGVALAAMGILLAISTRGPSVELGVGNVWKNITNMNFGDTGGVFQALFSNVAQGGLVFANALRINPDFPFSYIYVNMFSPFPSDLDNYIAIGDKYRVRITHASPMGAFSETYLFGWQYSAIFITAVMIAMRAATLKLVRGGSIMTIPILGMTMVMIYLAHHYPTRHTNRIMLMLLVFYAIDHFLNRRNRPRRARQRSASVALRGHPEQGT